MCIVSIAYLELEKISVHYCYRGCIIDLFIFYLFLILIWLRSVFEAHFHTDPKTKKNFLFGRTFSMLQDDFRPPLLKKNIFYARGRCF